ncbi:hypothetical protein [uncultured Corynebacterium sp.]|uniref:hypothetical protein n=1 Tax=uncultured Corynebacterium sp. TaxID=159447 RepID=UPI00261B4B80|nr:hypothetical protein [uncultured Corynebacterium sp.]
MTVPNPGNWPGSGVEQPVGKKGASISDSSDPHDRKTPPETVRYLLLAWVIMLGGELVHQLFGVVMGMLNPSRMMEAAREANKSVGSDAIGDDQVKFIVYVALGLMAVFTLAVVFVLVLALKAVAQQKGWARNALMLLVVFSVFFAMRMLTVVLVGGAATDGVPTAVVALDGVIQIIAGVAAVCGLIFASQEETKKWTAKPESGANGARRDHNDSSPVA